MKTMSLGRVYRQRYKTSLDIKLIVTRENFTTVVFNLITSQQQKLYINRPGGYNCS